jgi:hypothetical protein
MSDTETAAKKIEERLEYLRGEIVAERISYGEIAELQSLSAHIEPGDTLLLEWAGVPENDHKRKIELAKAKRQAAADSLHGIWAGLPKRAQRELLKKTYTL